MSVIIHLLLRRMQWCNGLLNVLGTETGAFLCQIPVYGGDWIIVFILIIFVDCVVNLPIMGSFYMCLNVVFFTTALHFFYYLCSKGRHANCFGWAITAVQDEVTFSDIIVTLRRP